MITEQELERIDKLAGVALDRSEDSAALDFLADLGNAMRSLLSQLAETKSSAGEILPLCTRVEVIDANGRSFVARYVDVGATLSVQDGGRTLKVFVGEPLDVVRRAGSDDLNG